MTLDPNDESSGPLPDDAPPSWACRQWGGFEHDWLDCEECVRAYEAQAWVTPDDPWYEDDGNQSDGEDN